MPKRRTEDVVHAVMTDHWIRRQPPSIDPNVLIAEPHGPATMYRGEVLPYYPANVHDLYLALAQVREGNNVEAGIPKLKASLNANKSARPEFYIELGDASGDPAFYQEALRRRPEFLPALLGLGNALDKSGKLELAAQTFERAAAASPVDPIAWHRLGEAYTKLHRSGDAIRALEKSIALDPEIPESHYALALADSKRAEASFRETIRLRPDDAPAHMNLAIVLFGDGRADESAYHFEHALRYKPDYALGHLNYGRMLKAIGKNAEATQHFTEAARSNDWTVRRSALESLRK